MQAKANDCDEVQARLTFLYVYSCVPAASGERVAGGGRPCSRGA